MARCCLCWRLWPALLLVAGCAPLAAPGGWGPYTGGPPPVALRHPNPMLLPVADREQFWNAAVDVIDDYFRIDRERRVRLVGDVLTEGRIDTFPRAGATLLEPHRGDSVGFYNRLESTLQTIRRRALVRVIPAEGGYLVSVEVFKELEDLAKPVRATAGSAVLLATTAPKQQSDELLPDVAEQGWISQGRDAALEQEILAKLHRRLALPVGR